MKLSEVLTEIQTRVEKSNLIDACSGDGCEVDMTDIPCERVIVHAEREFGLRKMKGKRADRLLFFIITAANTLFVVPIELESGNLRATRVVEQLQGGAELAELLVPQVGEFQIKFLPVAFSGNIIPEPQRKRLNRQGVSFCDLSKKVKTAQCGKKRSLADALFGAIPKTEQQSLEERARLWDALLARISD